MTITAKKLASAIDTIAEYLNEPYEFTDSDTGEVEIRNSMWYPQSRVLNGIAYSAVKALESAEVYQHKMQAGARAATRGHTGDEISEEKLRKALDNLERATLQVTTLAELREEAFKAYERHTGKGLRSSMIKTPAPKVDEANLSDEQKRARALLRTGEGNRGGGVDAAPWEAVA